MLQFHSCEGDGRGAELVAALFRASVIELV
jgi:hypothetical protein